MFRKIVCRRGVEGDNKTKWDIWLVDFVGNPYNNRRSDKCI